MANNNRKKGGYRRWKKPYWKGVKKGEFIKNSQKGREKKSPRLGWEKGGDPGEKGVNQRTQYLRHLGVRKQEKKIYAKNPDRRGKKGEKETPKKIGKKRL